MYFSHLALVNSFLALTLANINKAEVAWSLPINQGFGWMCFWFCAPKKTGLLQPKIFSNVRFRNPLELSQNIETFGAEVAVDKEGGVEILLAWTWYRFALLCLLCEFFVWANAVIDEPHLQLFDPFCIRLWIRHGWLSKLTPITTLAWNKMPSAFLVANWCHLTKAEHKIHMMQSWIGNTRGASALTPRCQPTFVWIHVFFYEISIAK